MIFTAQDDLKRFFQIKIAAGWSKEQVGRNLHEPKKEDQYFVSNCSLGLDASTLQRLRNNPCLVSGFFECESIEYHPSHDKEPEFEQRTQRLRSCFTLSLVKWMTVWPLSLPPKGIFWNNQKYAAF
ncbi:hypothetical protein CEXT_613971 [Caerostris extrusa]|uniref:Uncharacterized protein n=1 Tax=Caerostris extrusa TaxID=172846 RepID=A0AAV4W9P9_CAEEX|nr:hypothetical protein CEXT_613971 [Caerostris extrusa]